MASITKQETLLEQQGYRPEKVYSHLGWLPVPVLELVLLASLSAIVNGLIGPLTTGENPFFNYVGLLGAVKQQLYMPLPLSLVSPMKVKSVTQPQVVK